MQLKKKKKNQNETKIPEVGVTCLLVEKVSYKEDLKTLERTLAPVRLKVA